MFIVALLDRPHRNSFGMVPFVERRSSGELRIRGLSEWLSGKKISDTHLAHLLQSGHARDVSSLGATAPPTVVAPVAGWLGAGFEETARSLPVPTIVVPEKRFAVGSDGAFWIGPALETYSLLLSFTQEVAKRAVRNHDALLADLLMWVLPTRPETNSAIWYTRENVEEQERHLLLQMRFCPKRSRKELLDEYQLYVRSFLKNNT